MSAHPNQRRYFHQKSNSTGSEPWVIVDRDTNRIVDEALTQYEARQAVRNWNAGLHASDTSDTKAGS